MRISELAPTATTLPADIAGVVAQALAEDIGSGDRNAAAASVDQLARASVRAGESGVLAGKPWFEAVFRQLDPRTETRWHCDDGETLAAGDIVCELTGRARALLTGERTALNFLQLLSGTASATRLFVERIQGTNAAILDTRKTVPGLRSAQRYAVRCGGGHNHRFGLFDGILIKENHIAAAGSIRAAVERVRGSAPRLVIQIEVENISELEQALAADVQSVLLDNFALESLAQAVALCHGSQREAVLVEASGDINLDNVRAVAETGVDRISIGSLTKHIRALDFSLRLQPIGGQA